MVAALTITEVNYLVVSLFCDLVRPLSYAQYICGVKFIGCAVGLVSGIAAKATMPSRTSKSPSGKVIFKQMFSLNWPLQIVKLKFHFDFFLDSGVSLHCFRI